jgi:hypothetical protein
MIMGNITSFGLSKKEQFTDLSVCGISLDIDLITEESEVIDNAEKDSI